MNDILSSIDKQIFITMSKNREFMRLKEMEESDKPQLAIDHAEAIRRERDSVLDDISRSLSNLGQQGSIMNKELERQNKELEVVSIDVSDEIEHVAVTTKKTENLLNSRSHVCWILAFLILAVIILIIVLVS